ncbi:MAG: hypothetical protein JXM72_03785 [Deltaproteobacteria bacterium]|nr:hypothetical protein [Deltaproteobacteria bacterium]
MNTQKDNTCIALINKNDGMVLVLVLVVLVATIIIGVAIMRNSTTEAKIVVNERQYQQAFYDAVSGHEMAFAQSVSAVTTLGINEGSEYTYPVTEMPDDTNVTLKLTKIGKPAVGKGDDITKLEVRYYEMVSVKGDHVITLGAYKAFPKEQ